MRRPSRLQLRQGTVVDASISLGALAAELDVDELVLLTITYDFADRLRSYELVAEAFGLEVAQPPRATER